MKQKQHLTISLLIALIIISIACGIFGNDEPPHAGVFLKDGGDYIQLEEIEWFGWPSKKDVEGVPRTSDSKPVIILWHPKINLPYLEFSSVSEREQYRYVVNYRDDGIIEVSPSDRLVEGIYCFVQGDPMSAFLPAWCFEVR